MGIRKPQPIVRTLLLLNVVTFKWQRSYLIVSMVHCWQITAGQIQPFRFVSNQSYYEMVEGNGLQIMMIDINISDSYYKLRAVN